MSQDHVVLPKSTLMRFSTNGSLFYLDLESAKIERSFAKTYNTIKDYYPSHIEQYLSSEIERMISILYVSLKKFIESKGTYEYPNNLKRDLIRFIAVQQIRIPDLITIIRSQSSFAQFSNIPDLTFSPLHKPDLHLVDIAIKRFEMTYAHHEVNIAIIRKDCCSSSFLLTPTHCVSFDDITFVILSPYCSFVLLPENQNQELILNGDIQRYICFKTDAEVDPFIDRYINTAKKFTRQNLIGYKDQLEKVRQRLNEKQISLA